MVGHSGTAVIEAHSVLVIQAERIAFLTGMLGARCWMLDALVAIS